MPYAPSHICQCGRRVPSGTVCPCRAAARRDARAAHDATRPSARQRGYDSDWQQVRLAFLAVHPLCCSPGCSARATEVDHIVSVRDRPDLRLDPSNLRAMCKPHHSARTARDQIHTGGRVQTLAQGAGTVRGQKREKISKSVFSEFGVLE